MFNYSRFLLLLISGSYILFESYQFNLSLVDYLGQNTIFYRVDSIRNLDIKQCQFKNEVISLGIGLIITPSDIEIFSDASLSKKVAHFNVFNNPPMNICPIFNKPDYGIMHFVCLSKTDKAYKVLVNFSEVKYLPREKGYIFQTWEEYLKSSFGIRNIKSDRLIDNPIRQSNNSAAKIVFKLGGKDMLCPLEMKGDWLKVKYDCFYDKKENPYEGKPCFEYIGNCKNEYQGWIKWKNKNEILIDIFLML